MKLLFYVLSLFSRFPAPILPTVSQWEDMLSTAFSLAIVGYVINLAMGRTLAAKHGYDVDPNQVEELHFFPPPTLKPLSRSIL